MRPRLPRGAGARRAGLVLGVAGALLLVWGATVYFWQEPFTGLYTHFQQRRLADRYEERGRSYREPAVPGSLSTVSEESPGETGAEPGEEARREAERQDLAAAAKAYRLASREGEPIGRIVIPRLGIRLVVVNGTGVADLRQGPGRDLRTFMPGEGELVYIAGHRTTYGAPFRHIDRLQVGDPVYLEMPYGRFEYRVTGSEVVAPSQVEKLRSRGREELALQASHPPYSARQRFIVHARLAGVKPRRPSS